MADLPVLHLGLDLFPSAYLITLPLFLLGVSSFRDKKKEALMVESEAWDSY